MNDSPLKNYGFTYNYRNSEYMLDVAAHSEDEAKGRVAAMAGAMFVGELHEVPNNVITGECAQRLPIPSPTFTNRTTNQEVPRG